MAWSVYNLQFVIAKMYNLATMEIVLGHWDGIGIIVTIYLFDAQRQHMQHKIFICFMNFWVESKMLQYQIIAIKMVMVRMRKEQSHWVQLFLGNVIQQAVSFSQLIYTAVDNDGLTSLIRNYVSAFLTRVNYPFLNLQHTLKVLSVFLLKYRHLLQQLF